MADMKVLLELEIRKGEFSLTRQPLSDFSLQTFPPDFLPDFADAFLLVASGGEEKNNCHTSQMVQ